LRLTATSLSNPSVPVEGEPLDRIGSGPLLTRIAKQPASRRQAAVQRGGRDRGSTRSRRCRRPGARADRRDPRAGLEALSDTFSSAAASRSRLSASDRAASTNPSIGGRASACRPITAIGQHGRAPVPAAAPGTRHLFEGPWWPAPLRRRAAPSRLPGKNAGGGGERRAMPWRRGSSPSTRSPIRRRRPLAARERPTGFGRQRSSAAFSRPSWPDRRTEKALFGGIQQVGDPRSKT